MKRRGRPRGWQQPLVAARDDEVACAARYRHHSGRVGGVHGQPTPDAVGDVGAAREIEPLPGQVAHLARQDQAGAPVDEGREVVEREVGAGAQHAGLDPPLAQHRGRVDRRRVLEIAKTTLSPARHSTERTAWFRPSEECARKATPAGATPSTRAARARARSSIANISSRPAMPPLLRAPNRSQVVVCDRGQGASPPVQRCATPSSPTNSRLSMSATVVFLSDRM